MRTLLLAGTMLVLLGANGFAQSPKPTRFWNLTRYTVTSFQLSAPGQQSWGANLCKHDSDGTEGTLPGTLTVSLMAIAAGADMVRVHDVAEHAAALKVLDALRGSD